MSEMLSTVIEKVDEGPDLFEVVCMQFQALNREVLGWLSSEPRGYLCQILVV